MLSLLAANDRVEKRAFQLERGVDKVSRRIDVFRLRNVQAINKGDGSDGPSHLSGLRYSMVSRGISMMETRTYGAVTCYKSAHSLSAGITANINMYLAIVAYLSQVDGHILSTI